MSLIDFQKKALAARDDAASSMRSQCQMDRLRRPVLHLVSNVGFGGIAVQARDIAGALCDGGVCGGLMLLKASEADQQTREWYEEKVPVTVVSHDLERSAGMRRVRLHRDLFRSRPERLLHFHAFAHDYMDWRLILAARLAGKKVVVTCHHTVDWTTGWRQMPGQWLAAWLADRLIVTTEAGRRLVGRRYPLRKVRVIPCGVEMHEVPAVDRQQARASFGLGDDELAVGCVCRIHRKKGVFDLCASIRRMSPRLPRHRLLVAGDGAHLEALRREFADVPAIRFLGRVPDVKPLLSAIDVFALPSYGEGFGLVYAEAAMCGVPSIAGKLDTVAEVVVDGRTGWLVTPGDADALDAAIMEACGNAELRQERGRLALEHVRRFSLQAVAEAHQPLYEEVLNVSGDAEAWAASHATPGREVARV